MLLSWHQGQYINGWKSAEISRAVTSIVTGQHHLDPLASIVLWISSCDQVCNVSQFASVSEGELRIYDYDEGFEKNSFDLFHGDKEEGISWRYSR